MIHLDQVFFFKPVSFFSQDEEDAEIAPVATEGAYNFKAEANVPYGGFSF